MNHTTAPTPAPAIAPPANDNVATAVAHATPGKDFKRFVPGKFEVADYLVKGILPLHGVEMFGGQYSSGKTFVAMDLSLSIIHGKPYLGRRVKQGSVLWIAAEGAGIVEQRLEAARRAKFSNKIATEDFPFLWMEPEPQRGTDAILSNLACEISKAKTECDSRHPSHPLRLVVIDTLAAFFMLKDENDNAEIGTFMAKLGKIARDLEVLIMPICHVGKNADGGLRGASAFGAGADGVLVTLADIHGTTGVVTGPRTLSLAKTRSGVPGPLTSFTIEQVTIGTDRDGADIDVGYIEYAPVGTSGKGKAPSRRVRDLLDSINEAMLKHGGDVEVFEGEPRKRAVQVDFVRDEFMARHGVGDSTKDDSKRRAYDRAMADVLDSQTHVTRTVGLIEYIWPVQV